MRPVLPNLIVIGAHRCGTTSLHRYLDLHPEISMSARKELNFFVDEVVPETRRGPWERGLAWYEAQFDPNAPVRGESSPSYTLYPVYPGVPERMAATVPGARLIYLVRDPYERLVSFYRYRRYVIGIEDRSFAEAMSGLEHNRYVAGSCYAMQLERFLAAGFSLSQILVLEQRDLADRRRETLARVFAFLGVDATFTAPAFERRHNITEGLRVNRAGSRAIGLLDRAVGPRRSAALRARIPYALARPLLRRPAVPPTRPDPAAFEHVTAALHADAERLRALTGLPFADWSV